MPHTATLYQPHLDERFQGPGVDVMPKRRAGTPQSYEAKIRRFGAIVQNVPPKRCRLRRLTQRVIGAEHEEITLLAGVALSMPIPEIVAVLATAAATSAVSTALRHLTALTGCSMSNPTL